MKFLRFDDEFIKTKEIVRISAWYQRTQENKLKKDLMISAIDSFDRAARNRGFEEGKKAIQQIMRKALGL